jgi:hypothetical protein
MNLKKMKDCKMCVYLLLIFIYLSCLNREEAKINEIIAIGKNTINYQYDSVFTDVYSYYIDIVDGLQEMNALKAMLPSDKNLIFMIAKDTTDNFGEHYL